MKREQIKTPLEKRPRKLRFDPPLTDSATERNYQQIFALLDRDQVSDVAALMVDGSVSVLDVSQFVVQGDKRINHNAVRSLKKAQEFDISLSDAMWALSRLCHDEDTELKYDVMSAIAKAAEKGDDVTHVISKMRESLGVESVEIQSFAATILLHAADGIHEITKVTMALSDAIRNPNPEVYGDGIEGFAKILVNPDYQGLAFDEFSRLRLDFRPEVRCRAMHALKKAIEVGYRGFSFHTLLSFEDEDEKVQAKTSEALGAMIVRDPDNADIIARYHPYAALALAFERDAKLLHKVNALKYAAEHGTDISPAVPMLLTVLSLRKNYLSTPATTALLAASQNGYKTAVVRGISEVLQSELFIERAWANSQEYMDSVVEFGRLLQYMRQIPEAAA